MLPPLEKLISGGQTGADRAALDVAIRHRFLHGGWCPKGRKAEDGPLADQYQLVETPSVNYLQRTGWNVRDSDGTVVFTLAKDVTGGSLRTIEFARKHRKPCAHISRARNYRPAEALIQFIAEHGIKVLNVAGSRASKEPELYHWVTEVLEAAFLWGENPPGMFGGPGEG